MSWALAAALLLGAGAATWQAVVVGRAKEDALAAKETADAKEAETKAVLDFVLQYFPTQFGFISQQLDAFRTDTVALGVTGSIAIGSGWLSSCRCCSVSSIMPGSFPESYRPPWVPAMA